MVKGFKEIKKAKNYSSLVSLEFWVFSNEMCMYWSCVSWDKAWLHKGGNVTFVWMLIVFATSRYFCLLNSWAKHPETSACGSFGLRLSSSGSWVNTLTGRMMGPGTIGRAIWKSRSSQMIFGLASHISGILKVERIMLTQDAIIFNLQMVAIQLIPCKMRW